MDRRGELLSASLEYVGEHGLATLTLRPLAAAVGTSDRMLVYYFGSREGLVTALLDRAFSDLDAAWRAEPVARPSDLVRAVWKALNRPAIRPTVRLFLEAGALAGTDERWRRQLDEATTRYLETALHWLVETGVDPATAPAAARLAWAALDGLVLQLGVDGDRDATDAAVDLLARQLDLLTG